MFKYVWIIMIVVVIALFIAYTIWCIYDTYDICGFDSIGEFLEDFYTEHLYLFSIWIAILIVGSIALFVASIATWLKSRG